MEFEGDGWLKEFTNSLQLDSRRRLPSMESEMMQNSTSNFAITFNKHDNIQDDNVFKINKYDLLQPKKFNQFQQN